MEDLITEKLYVDDESKKLIHSSYKIYTVIATFFVLTSLMSLCSQVFRYFKHADQNYHNLFNIFNFQVFPIIAIVQLALGCFEFYYYFKALQCQHIAATESDQGLFNMSFRFFIKATRLAMVMVLIHFLYEIIFFYQATHG